MNNRFDELPTETKRLLALYGVFVVICGLLTIWALTI